MNPLSHELYFSILRNFIIGQWSFLSEKETYEIHEMCPWLSLEKACLVVSRC